ncbi:MAG TPA: DUF4915 domain-containing protein [Candidatus Melainabacteria bacterium]|nr:DUF4915 domain-containing protein [Candidatus Melainabacteria bacterium]
MSQEVALNLQQLDELWSRHHAQWRDSAQVTSHWDQAAATDAELLAYESSANGRFFEVLKELDITLLISREYEHLLLALTVDPETDQPRITFFNMPHPSGIAVDRDKGSVHVASTRNPNQIFEMKPVSQAIERLDSKMASSLDKKPLIPVKSVFLPGCLYMHDLAFIGGNLHANAVGHNAVARISKDGSYERAWWPKCIETDEAGMPVFGQNHIQLNSIAAGLDLESSFFSASSTAIENLRPGDPDYPVDGRGVVFSGKTREIYARGLTRPHSARLINGEVWVDNSGYGELGYCKDGKFQAAVKLPGWTRGLCAHKNVAFVGTSRVIPRFSQYAPGLDVNKSICGIHAVDLESGEILGSVTWRSGNQIFAIEWVDRAFTLGFPFSLDRREEEEKLLFYSYET